MVCADAVTDVGGYRVPMTDRIVECAQCGRRNRVRAAASGVARCGRFDKASGSYAVGVESGRPG